MTVNRKHCIILKSEDRESHSKSAYDCTFHLGDSFLHEIKYCKFKDFIMPNQMYNITSSNNTIDYDLNGTPTSKNLTVGYYTVSTFVTAMNTLLASDIVIADNSTTHIFDFTSAVNTYIKVSSTMASVLGITADGSPSTSYSANKIYNFIPTRMIHIASNALAENDNSITSNSKKYAIIASIPISVGWGFQMTFSDESDTSDFSKYLGHKNISNVDIKLLDDSYNVIDNNSGDWTATFNVFYNND